MARGELAVKELLGLFVWVGQEERMAEDASQSLPFPRHVFEQQDLERRL
jgi:hypothetical protein